MALKISAERVPLSFEAPIYWKKLEYHKNACCGNPCSCSQCSLLLVQRETVASSQQT